MSFRYWYPGPDGQPAGPVSAQEIRDRLASGALRSTSPLCREGLQEWHPASEFPDLGGVTPATHYFFKRDGMKIGPHSVEEIRGLLRDTELTASSEVMARGTGTWVPVSSVPALLESVPAMAAQGTAPTGSAAPRPAPGSRASAGPGLKPVPYTPGADPGAIGPFLRYSCPAADVGAHLETLRAWDAPPPPVPGARWKLRLQLGGAILAVALVAVVADLAMGFKCSPFAFLIPFSVIGMLLVVAATGAPRPRPGWMSEHKGPLGCVSLLVAWPIVLGLSNYAYGDSLTVSPVAWLLGLVFAVGLAALIDTRETAPQRERWDLGRMEDCKAVAEALEHDAMPGKPAAGWMDLTGPRQESKLCRKGATASGRSLRLYRDEWWRLTLPLRDGNRLRISGVERVKVKAAVPRRKRSKPEDEERITTLEVKLGVNTAAYRILPHFTPAMCGQLQPGPIQTGPDSVSTAARIRGARFRPKDALTLLALVYARLERVTPGPGGQA